MTLEQAEQASSPSESDADKRVVYLLGAGATQGCLSYCGSSKNLLMPALREPISKRFRANIEESDWHHGVGRLVNDLLADTDVEHLLTFLEESPSETYRDFAMNLRAAFSTVLREELSAVQREFTPSHSALYAALVDMHQIRGTRERLMGFLTLNYDVFLEDAIAERHHLPIDYGVNITTTGQSFNDMQSIPVLKLHGSFGWSWDWPIQATLDHERTFWIPPGIRKPKSDYPFNLIWGRARELLDCDVLRIIGCNLGPNDWDLVSLLFATRHLHAYSPPYRIEVISRVETADAIAKLFPYLGVQSLLDIREVRDQVISEALAISADVYENLSADRLQDAKVSFDARIANPFAYWLRQKGEEILRRTGSLETPTGIFQDFIDSES